MGHFCCLAGPPGQHSFSLLGPNWIIAGILLNVTVMLLMLLAGAVMLLPNLDVVVTTQPHECLQGLLTSCMQHTDFKSMPSQVICLTAAIKFTQQAEQAIEAGKLPSLQVCSPPPLYC